jgi:hypothetical protein
MDVLTSEVSYTSVATGRGSMKSIMDVGEQEGFSPSRAPRAGYTSSTHFSTSFNKAQGQTFDWCGLDLHTDCFAHGQLYVACSRVGRPANLYIYTDGGTAKNIVYPRAYGSTNNTGAWYHTATATCGRVQLVFYKCVYGMLVFVFDVLLFMCWTCRSNFNCTRQSHKQ